VKPDTGVYMTLRSKTLLEVNEVKPSDIQVQFLMRHKHAETGETAYPTLTVLECTVDGISGKNR